MKKIKGKEIIEELKTPALLVVGMIGGNMAGKMIDNVLKVDESTTGFNLKGMAKPLVQLTAGVGGSILLKDKNLKMIAGGVAASGVISSVKVLLKKDILNGFNGLGEADGLSALAENLRIDRYNPDLPELPASAYAMDIEVDPYIGTLEDYEEIQEVEVL